jgi:hypothetical protein
VEDRRGEGVEGGGRYGAGVGGVNELFIPGSLPLVIGVTGSGFEWVDGAN